MTKPITGRRRLLGNVIAGFFGGISLLKSPALADDKPLVVEGSGTDFTKAMHEAVKNAALSVKAPDGTVDWKLSGITGSVTLGPFATSKVTVALEIVKL